MTEKMGATSTQPENEEGNLADYLTAAGNARNSFDDLARLAAKITGMQT